MLPVVDSHRLVALAEESDRLLITPRLVRIRMVQALIEMLLGPTVPVLVDLQMLLIPPVVGLSQMEIGMVQALVEMLLGPTVPVLVDLQMLLVPPVVGLSQMEVILRVSTVPVLVDL